MKRRSYVTALAMLTAAPTAWAAMNIQPDPENPTGYIISRADVEAVEQQKTADPMYQIWSQALRTAPNHVS